MVFYEGLAVPEYYEIDHRAKDYVTQAHDVLLDIFANFERRARDFDDFRVRLRHQPAAFIDEIRAVFFVGADKDRAAEAGELT